MLGGLALLALSTSGALADQAMERVEVKTTPDKAWAAVGDFCAIKDWHPAIVSCELDADGKKRIRTLTTKDGSKIVEQETYRNDAGHSYGYTILESPLPVESYHATIRILPIEPGRVSIVWSSSYKSKGPAADAQKAVSGIYSAGLENLKAQLEGH